MSVAHLKNEDVWCRYSALALASSVVSETLQLFSIALALHQVDSYSVQDYFYLIPIE